MRMRLVHVVPSQNRKGATPCGSGNQPASPTIGLLGACPMSGDVVEIVGVRGPGFALGRVGPEWLTGTADPGRATTAWLACSSSHSCGSALAGVPNTRTSTWSRLPRTIAGVAHTLPCSASVRTIGRNFLLMAGVSCPACCPLIRTSIVSRTDRGSCSRSSCIVACTQPSPASVRTGSKTTIGIPSVLTITEPPIGNIACGTGGGGLRGMSRCGSGSERVIRQTSFPVSTSRVPPLRSYSYSISGATHNRAGTRAAQPLEARWSRIERYRMASSAGR